MEEKRPEMARRPVSFNPKAAAFNPSTEAFVPSGSFGKYGSSTSSTSPQQTAGVPDTSQDDDPFRPAPEMRPTYYETSDEPSGSQPSGAQYDPRYLALDELRDMIRAIDQAQHEAAQSAAFRMQSIHTAVPYPSFSAPEVDELTTTLGLPSVARKEKPTDATSPVCPPDPPNSQDDTKSGLHGQLVRALNKPFTADMLVDYLNSKGVLGPTAPARPRHLSNDLSTQSEQRRGEGSPVKTKLVQPPPGFSGERARVIHDEEHPRVLQTEEEDTIASPIPERKPTPTGPSKPTPTVPAVFSRARRFSELPSANISPQSPHHHAQYRVPGSRRHTRARAPTRTRRTDQGPEPSTADIYPDDAVYISPASSRRTSRAAADTTIPFPDFDVASMRRPSRAADATAPFPDFDIASPHQPAVRDPILWPTPAEVYAPEPRPSTTINRPPHPRTNTVPTTTSTTHHHPSSFAPRTTCTTTAPPDRPPFDLFEDHYPPTTADILATDPHVDALLLLTPYLFALDMPDAVPRPERPLTQSQLDGSRYGLRYYGIGLGDDWKGAARRVEREGV